MQPEIEAFQMAGEFGDGWIPGRVPIEQYPKSVSEIWSHARQAGRDPNGFTVASEIYACLASTDRAARQKASRTIETLLSRGGFATTAAQESFADHALIGGPDEVAEKVHEYAAAGVRHFEMKFIYPSISDLHEQLELFSESVVSSVRGVGVS